MGRKYTVRHSSRRKLDQCVNHLERITDHFSDIAVDYNSNPMRIKDALEKMTQLTLVLKDLVTSVRESM